MLKKATYSFLTLGLVLAISLYGYRTYSRSDRAVMEKVYRNIEGVDDGAGMSPNPIRLSRNEESVFIRLYPYKEKAGDFLLAKLETEKDPIKRQVILKLLPELGCTDCMNTLESYLKDDDERMVILALTALQKLDHKRMRELIYGIIDKNESARVVPWAVFLLSKIGGEDDYVFITGLASKAGYQSKPMQKAIAIAKVQLEEKGIGSKAEGGPGKAIIR